MQLHEHPFFAGAHCREVAELISQAVIRRFDSDAILFDEGDDSDGFYLLLEGRVRFEKRSGAAGDRYRVVGEATSGEAFGEMSVLSARARFVRVTTAEPSVVATLPAGVLRAIRDSMNPLARRLGDVLVRHLCDTTRRYIEDSCRQDRLVALGTMVGSIAHDLRTPLTLINLNAQLVETVASTSADAALAVVLGKHCRNIEAQVERMSGMLEEVSDFTRGCAGDEFSRIDLVELFETFRFLNSPQWESAGVTVEFRGEKTRVEAAPRKLLRVLQNLVGNAVDALEGRSDGRIVIETGLLDARHAFIRVSDNGPGIPKKILANFWEPFVTCGKERGTGLGTAICKALVEAHGGRITFETSPETGTQFDILLPVRHAKHRPAPDAVPALLRSAGR